MKNESDQLKIFQIEWPVGYLKKANAFLLAAIQIHRKERLDREQNIPELPDGDGPEFIAAMETFNAKLDKYREAERRARELKLNQIDEEDYKQLSMIYVGRANRFLRAIPKTDYGVFEKFVGPIKDAASRKPKQLSEYSGLRDMHEHGDEYLIGTGRNQEKFEKEIVDKNGNRLGEGIALGGWAKSDDEIWIGAHMEIVSFQKILNDYSSEFAETYQRFLRSDEFRRLS